MTRGAGPRGFTLVELTIVLLITTILATVSVTVYRRMVEKARMTQAPVALSHLKKTQFIHYSAADRFTDNLSELDFNPVRYDYYDISVTVPGTDNGRSFIGFATGRGAMTGDLWTVTDKTDPAQDNGSQFRSAWR